MSVRASLAFSALLLGACGTLPLPTTAKHSFEVSYGQQTWGVDGSGKPYKDMDEHFIVKVKDPPGTVQSSAVNFKYKWDESGGEMAISTGQSADTTQLGEMITKVNQAYTSLLPDIIAQVLKSIEVGLKR